MIYFDSHCHYNDPKFNEYPGGASAAIAEAFAAGVCGMLVAGTSPETSDECIALAESDTRIFAAAGLHPGDIRFFDESGDNETLDEIAKRLTHPRVVALGEIGLDYHYGTEDAERQKKVFDAQLSIAEKYSMPVIIHDRDAHGDTFDIIRAHPNVIGVMHSFSGSSESALDYVRLGYYISFSGPVTYKNAKNVKRAASVVPLERILIETDAPYLPPEPHRGEINRSAFLEFTAAETAKAASVDTDTLCRATVENAKRLFGLDF